MIPSHSNQSRFKCILNKSINRAILKLFNDYVLFNCNVILKDPLSFDEQYIISISYTQIHQGDNAMLAKYNQYNLKSHYYIHPKNIEPVLSAINGPGNFDDNYT